MHGGCKVAIEKISRKCTVKHTPICKFLGSDGCEKCSLYKNNVKEYEKAKTNEIWQVTQNNLPWNADQFHQSETCFFCKKRPGNSKAGYAMLDMAHPDPPYEKGMIFGLGSLQRADVGSLIPFPIAICKECRRHYRLAENFKFYSAVVGFLVGLGVVLSVAKTEFIQYSPEYIPIVILLFVMAVVYALGGWISRKLVKKYGDETYFRVFDIPEMAEMAELGWFVYRDEQEKTRLLLTKKKPREHFCFFSDDPRQPGDE